MGSVAAALLLHNQGLPGRIKGPACQPVLDIDEDICQAPTVRYNLLGLVVPLTGGIVRSRAADAGDRRRINWGGLRLGEFAACD